MQIRRRPAADVPVPERDREWGCAFCGENIVASGRDPLALNIVAGFRGGCELEQLPGSTIYSHIACLLDRVDPELRDLVEG